MEDGLSPDNYHNPCYNHHGDSEFECVAPAVMVGCI